jgi:UDP-glucose 4-epimerase
MKILLTGGAGFIGSHLAEKYLEMGHKVFVIDDLSTGRIENIHHSLTTKAYAGRVSSFTVIPSSTVRSCWISWVSAIRWCTWRLQLGVQYILDNPTDFTQNEHRRDRSGTRYVSPVSERRC